VILTNFDSSNPSPTPLPHTPQKIQKIDLCQIMLLFVVALELSSKLILKTNTTWNANQFSDGDGERRFNAKENEQSIFLQLFGGTGVLFRKVGKGTNTQTSIRSYFV
jgi:hypothetical protein